MEEQEFTMIVKWQPLLQIKLAAMTAHVKGQGKQRHVQRNELQIIYSVLTNSCHNKWWEEYVLIYASYFDICIKKQTVTISLFNTEKKDLTFYIVL